MISYSPGALRPMFAPFRIPPVSAPLNHSIASTRPLPPDLSNVILSYGIREDDGSSSSSLWFHVDVSRVSSTSSRKRKGSLWILDIANSIWRSSGSFSSSSLHVRSRASFQVAFKVSLGRREMNFRTGSKYVRGFAKYQSGIFSKIVNLNLGTGFGDELMK